MIFALRAPAVPEGGGVIPEQTHHGHAAKHHSSSSATASELGFEAEQAVEAEGSVVDAPSFTAPSFSAPSFSAPSFDAPSPDAAQPTNPPASPPPPPPAAAAASSVMAAAAGRDADGRSENPYIKKYVTQDLRNYWVTQLQWAPELFLPFLAHFSTPSPRDIPARCRIFSGRRAQSDDVPAPHPQAEMEAKRKGNSDFIRENFGTCTGSSFFAIVEPPFQLSTSPPPPNAANPH